MASQVGGDLLRLVKFQVTAGANLPAKTFVNLDGTLPNSAAVCTGGVTVTDVASGDIVEINLPPSIVAVYAAGTVTAGLMVEGLQASISSNINGALTAVTGTGVQNVSSGYPLGRALTSGVAGDTVQVNLSVSQVKLV